MCCIKIYILNRLSLQTCKFSGNCRFSGNFISARKHRHFFFWARTYRNLFRPKFADILFDRTLPAFFFSTRNRRHIFRPEIAGISSYTKLPPFFPTQNCRHIFRPEISGIISNPKLPAFFRSEIGTSKSSSYFLLSVQ